MTEPKRFYKTVSVEKTTDGFAILLDGRSAKTPARKVLAAPNEAVAELVAEEWAAQEETVTLTEMTATRHLTTALDRGTSEAAAWREEVLEFFRTDLLCYRAEAPDALAERQREIWDPYLAWAGRVHGVELTPVAGVIAVEQSPAALAAAARVLGEADAFDLIGLKTAAALSGSGVLALAVWKGDDAPEALFAAARLDEAFQAEKWGVDAEAAAREAGMRQEFLCVAAYLRALR
ncbi:MAG: ATP12 family protein [Pseudomonadota bacterium]